MKKIVNYVFLLLLTVTFYSCSKDIDEQINSSVSGAVADNKIQKDFEISPKWFDRGGFKTKSFPIGDIYNNFGEGLDCLNMSDRHSLFRVDTSLEPLVATTLEERTSIRYTATNNYLDIDNEVKTELAAALGVDVWKVEIDANLSVTKSNRISQDSKSIYVNVLYVKKYGKGRFQFTHPSINNYLLYPTNLNNPAGSNDGISISNSTFRNTYGDRFKSIITFGCLLNATIQITNVDFDGEQKETVEADAKAKIGKWVETSVSWESLSTNSRHFHSSSLMIDGTIIPRGGLILNHDDLLNEIHNLDQLYANHDLGVILNAYDDYSLLYPTYGFINYQFYLNQIKQLDSLIYYYTWMAETFKGTDLEDCALTYIATFKKEQQKYEQLSVNEPFDVRRWKGIFLTICQYAHYPFNEVPFMNEFSEFF